MVVERIDIKEEELNNPNFFIVFFAFRCHNPQKQNRISKRRNK